jgi:hypothetical protein
MIRIGSCDVEFLFDTVVERALLLGVGDHANKNSDAS